ncbi:MAG: hypothetical protein AAF394_09025, partial [Planctomycetota bacterium]
YGGPMLRWSDPDGFAENEKKRRLEPRQGPERLDAPLHLRAQLTARPQLVTPATRLTWPKQELDGEIGQSHVGLQARLMSQSMRKLTGAIARSKTVVIFINQIREKVGVMFGSPETTSGGRALKFYSSCRIDVRRIGQLKDGEDVVGQRVRTKIVKNKVAPPFRVAEFDMMHNSGISFEGDLLDLGTQHKIINRSGAWFKYNDTYLGQGKEKARAFLLENKDVASEIKDLVMSAGGYLEMPIDGEKATEEKEESVADS